jgi:hypothetical protein
MSGRAGQGRINLVQERRMLDERKKRKHDLMLITPPPDWREYFDHYLGKCARLVDHWHALLSWKQHFPCQLVFAALYVRAQGLRQPPPPLSRYMQVQFPALQLQRFLRGFVLATAHALVAPPAGVFCLVHAMTRRRWIDRVFVRVMSGFVKRAKVLQQEARRACAFRPHPAYCVTMTKSVFHRKHGGE